MSVFNPSIFVGTFAGEAAALTQIQTRKWDSLSNGTGTPVDGMYFYDSVASALKIYIAGWQIITLGSASTGIKPIDFWSEPQAVASIPAGAAGVVALPSVVVPNIALGTFVRVICMVKYRKARNSSALESKINANTNVQVKESVAGAFTDCINFKTNMIRIPAGPGDNPGDAVIGDDDVKAQVSAVNKTYDFQFDASCLATNGPIELHDIQTGIRIYYS